MRVNGSNEEYVRLAEPAYQALQVLIGEETETPVYIISHEFMGMPLAMKTQIERKSGNGAANMRTVFLCS